MHGSSRGIVASLRIWLLWGLIPALVFVVGPPPAPASAGPGVVPTTTVGYLGCSLTYMTVNGYHADGGTRLWPTLPGYAGGDIPTWFRDLTDPTPTFWPLFARTLASSPTTTFWMQSCIKTDEIAPSNVSNAQAIVAHIRALVPGATIYVSTMNSWDPATNCPNAGPSAVAAAQQVTDTLVAQGLALRGPTMPLLPGNETVDGCHPDTAGQALLGQALVSFFDAPAPPPPSGFTQTPTDPSGSSVTFAFSITAGQTASCTLDANPAFACTSPATLTGLAGGSHTFTVRLSSSTGTKAPPPSAFSWTVDVTPPPTPRFVTTPTDPSGRRAQFSFTDDEAGVTFTCSLDGAAQTACVSPIQYGDLANGPHTLRVRAVDEVGNRSTAAKFAWTVDRTLSS